MTISTSKKMLRSAAFMALAVGLSMPLYAQDAPPSLEQVQADVVANPPDGSAEEMQTASLPPAQQAPINPNVFNPNEYNSLLFTYWELTAIEDARASTGDVRGVEDYELARAMKEGEGDPKPMPPPEQRDIKLGGIVYHGKDDWTIWLNSKRVTPKALPTEVHDLRVHSEYIEMKWFDEYTNQIFPIRLRPHQRFNIDSRMFLPG
ncbi:MAG: hypothetical protein KTR28_08970 [Micavibrio sp.]|nr:hypothetical protein [Micavibrio sp.]